jgi:hypothetical protein
MKRDINMASSLTVFLTLIAALALNHFLGQYNSKLSLLPVSFFFHPTFILLIISLILVTIVEVQKLTSGAFAIEIAVCSLFTALVIQRFFGGIDRITTWLVPIVILIFATYNYSRVALNEYLKKSMIHMCPEKYSKNARFFTFFGILAGLYYIFVPVGGTHIWVTYTIIGLSMLSFLWHWLRKGGLPDSQPVTV